MSQIDIIFEWNCEEINVDDEYFQPNLNIHLADITYIYTLIKIQAKFKDKIVITKIQYFQCHYKATLNIDSIGEQS